MERRMIGTTRRQMKLSTWTRNMTKVMDKVERVKILKIGKRWVTELERWTKKVVECKSVKERPQERYTLIHIGFIDERSEVL